MNEPEGWRSEHQRWFSLGDRPTRGSNAVGRRGKQSFTGRNFHKRVPQPLRKDGVEHGVENRLSEKSHPSGSSLLKKLGELQESYDIDSCQIRM